MRGGESLGTDSGSLEEIWRIILSFTEYSFCKAHSASFALVSYKLAFMKRYFPLEFMVSVINNQGGYYSCQTYLNEARRMGFEILPPDVNKSQIYHSPEGNAIRIGLQQLRNLSRGFLHGLIRNRETGGEYRSLIDFAERCSPAISTLRVLIRSGALDQLADGVSRPGLFWIFFRINDCGGLFLAPPVPAYIGDYTPQTKLLYSGEWRDSQTGMDYLRARWYNPANGLFNRTDPFAGNNQDPQSLHKYNYVHNNPVMGIDPTGLMSIGDVSLSMSISNMMRSLQVFGYVKAAKLAAGSVIGLAVLNDWLQGMQAGVGLDAFIFGAGINFPMIPKLQIGGAGCLEVVVGKHTGNGVPFFGTEPGV